MTRPWIVTLASALLTLVIATALWLAWPTGRAFSFLNDARPTYTIAYRADVEAIKRGDALKSVRYDVRKALDDINRATGSTGTAYAVLSVSMQDRLRFRTSLASNVNFVKAIGDYREARGLTLIAGREPRVNTAEAALSEATARLLTPRPTDLIGQQVTLNDHINATPLTITGIVRSSAWQSDTDPDAGGYRMVDPSKPAFDPMDAALLNVITPPITIVFQRAPTANTVTWLRAYVTKNLQHLTLTDVQAATRADTVTAAILKRLQERARSLPLLAALLTVSGLLALCALTLATQIRRRTLLGIELAIGARRHALLLEVLVQQAVPALLGAAAGAALAFTLPAVLPGVLTGRPPLRVLLLASLLPVASLLTLTSVISWGVLRESAAALLRSARPGAYVRPLLALMLLAFICAFGGVLSAAGVKEKLDAQATRINTQFGRVLEIATSDDGDNRKGQSLGHTSRRLTSDDAQWLTRQPGVHSAAVGERINGGLKVGTRTYYSNRMVTGTPSLVGVLGLDLLEGDAGGCVLSRTSARAYGLRVGSVMELPSGGTYRSCPVTGIFADPEPLKKFVMLNFPEVIVPIEIGLASKQGASSPLDDPSGQPTPALRTTHVLLRLTGDATPDELQRLRARIEARLPGMTFSLRPYAPNIDALLARLQLQSRVFLTLGGAAAIMSVFGLLSGFLAYLDVTRYRTALDRAQGMTLRQVYRSWVLGSAALGVFGVGVALLIAALLTPALYNAFSLDAPVGMARDLLPAAVVALPGPLSVTFAAVITALLVLTVLLLGARWTRRQSLTTLLKAGS
ncbi:ABC transporter permease [Deinococcus pimensis]|uniref:ABC transporter permease n=1 Tax=Deinococcus pimensis TaxID=309888 RepID=UPI000481AC29|nr:ABC transporter permease [Deinococcus pimensis]